MKKSVKAKLNIAAIVVMVAVIVLLLPILIVALTLIIKSVINPDYPPDIFGYAPLTVASGSMSGNNEDSFDKGDLVFIKILTESEINELQVGDVICYIDGDVYVTHRITEIEYSSQGVIEYVVTMGDANYAEDDPVYAEYIFGVYAGRIANLGNFAEFLQSSAGMVVFIGVPVVAFVLLIIIMLGKNKDEEIARLKKSLEEQQSSDGEDKG